MIQQLSLQTQTLRLQIEIYTFDASTKSRSSVRLAAAGVRQIPYVTEKSTLVHGLGRSLSKGVTFFSAAVAYSVCLDQNVAASHALKEMGAQKRSRWIVILCLRPHYEALCPLLDFFDF